VEAGDSKQSTHRREATVKVKGNLEVEARIEEMHDAGFLEKEIAVDVGVSRSTITLALSRLYEKRGLPKPDGRLVRHQHGPSEDSIYVRHAAKAFELWQAGKSLRAIGTELGICDITAKQSIAYWCRQHDLPEPTVESRRQEWIDQAVAAVSAGASINEVARQLKKSPATIRSWLAER
jgi:DNA-binding NarL/FixJ family response regulator